MSYAIEHISRLLFQSWTDGQKILIDAKGLYLDEITRGRPDVILYATDKWEAMRQVLQYPYRVGTFYLYVPTEWAADLSLLRPELEFRLLVFNS